MPYKRPTLVAAVVVVVTIDTVAHAQTDQKKFDPYSQGAKAGEKFDPYQQGARAGDKLDPYSQGTNKNDSTVSALNPSAQPANVEKGRYDTYIQDAKTGDKFDPYSQDVKAGGKFDPYSKGANKRGALKQQARADWVHEDANVSPDTSAFFFMERRRNRGGDCIGVGVGVTGAGSGTVLRIVGA